MSASTENEARTSARVLLFAAAGVLVAAVTATPFVAAGACAATGIFLVLRSSAHDFGAAGLGGEGLDGSSTLPFTSESDAGAGPVDSSGAGAGDLGDFCAVEAALGAFADLIGMSGTAGLVAVRACFVAVADGWTGSSVRSSSDGGCEVEGVSTSVSEGTATVDACEGAGSSVGVRVPCSSWSTGCSREGSAKPCSSVDTGALRRLGRREARAGKAASGTESQGRGG